MIKHKFLYQKIYNSMLENILNGAWADGLHTHKSSIDNIVCDAASNIVKQFLNIK